MGIKIAKSAVGKVRDIYDRLWPSYENVHNSEEIRCKLMMELVDELKKQNIRCLQIISNEENNPLKKTIQVELGIEWFSSILKGCVKHHHWLILKFGNEKSFEESKY